MRRILVEWRAAERARRAGAPSVEVLIDIGDPALTIVRVSEDLEADLIFMGRRGRGGLAACAAMTVC
jgi:nucleotide-binding universal stress UspA family protein